MKVVWRHMTRRLAAMPKLAWLAALLLLSVGLFLALYNERIRKEETIQQALVQARILAESVAASLAFDDATATRDSLNALKVDQAIEAAAVYDLRGNLVAGYALRDALPPRANSAVPALQGRMLVVTAAVSQGSAKLGSVYLRMATESLAQRIIRYLGISIVVIATSVFLMMLGTSSASLADANRKLQEEIREREKAQEALRQAQKMEAMGQLTGGVAHDFNNLLMAASSGLELMERTSDPARRERLRQGVRQAIDRGASLTQQLLAFARRTPLRPRVIDLVACVQDMFDLLERSLREDIKIDLSSAADVWPVEVDPSQLQVAILNVALNARDAMPSGGVIRIRIENAPAEDHHGKDMVRLSLTDSGTGIPRGIIARVFEPFFTTKEIGNGTGLGLSQVYGFMRASGGETRIDSELGKGTMVSLLLPRSHKRVPVQDPASHALVNVSTQKRRVLLVEDDDNVARLVAEMLVELGYDVTRTANAAAALDALGTRPPFDLVFSDMVMPGTMDGLQLAGIVTERWSQIPVVLTTGYSSAGASAAAKGLRVLIKPYRMEALAAELETALQGSRVRLSH